MSELDEKIVAEIDKVYSFSPYDTKRECETAKNNSKAAKAIEILVLAEMIASYSELSEKLMNMFLTKSAREVHELAQKLTQRLNQLKQQ